MPHFRLTYKLTGAGWAKAEVSDGGEQLSIRISYIGPGIEAAADEAIALLQAADHSEFEWWDEPGCAAWVLEKQEDYLQITIGDGPLSRRRGEQAQTLFRAITTPLKFAIQVWDALRHLLEEHGEQRYEERWLRSFPMHKYQTLDRLIREAKRAAREERKGKEQHSG